MITVPIIQEGCMKTLHIAVFLGLILFCLPDLRAADHQSDHSSLRGHVYSAETDAPLLGAHVFLSGTSIGTVTNPGGHFQLRNISPGKYDVVISIIGYERITQEIILLPGEEQTLSIELQPMVYDLGEIYAGNLDERWEASLERFKNLFLGESQLADSVDILNPEVLRFERRWWGRFTAEALAPLQIENRATGYHITYHLDEFSHSGRITRWDGDSFFSELTPADSAEAAYRTQNRIDAFRGSLRHFYLSLIQDRVDEEGFSVYNNRPDLHTFARRDRVRITRSRLIRSGDEEGFYHFRFSGNLEIVYRNADEDPRFVQWAPDLRRGPQQFQTSYLELNEQPITIDSNGEVQETYGVTRSGYMSFRRFAETMPKDYRPRNWEPSLAGY